MIYVSDLLRVMTFGIRMPPATCEPLLFGPPRRVDVVRERIEALETHLDQLLNQTSPQG